MRLATMIGHEKNMEVEQVSLHAWIRQTSTTIRLEAERFQEELAFCITWVSQSRSCSVVVRFAWLIVLTEGKKPAATMCTGTARKTLVA